MKNKIVFINIFYEILEYACEFGLAYIVSRLVAFRLEWIPGRRVYLP